MKGKLSPRQIEYYKIVLLELLCDKVGIPESTLDKMADTIRSEYPNE